MTSNSESRPPQPQHAPRGVISLRLRQACRVLRQDLPKLSLLRDRKVHGHIVTMQQSGTHWLMHMLWVAMAEVYGVSEPSDIDDRSLIGDHKHPPVYPHIPRVIQTHNIPSSICHSWPVRTVLSFPRYVILLRDIRSSLVSNYEKHHVGRMTFSEYLRNDRLIANPIRWDLWCRIRFLNAWDREVQRLPAEQTLIVYYERMREDPLGELLQIWDFLKLPGGGESVLARAVSASTKDRMSRKESGQKPAGVIRVSRRHPFEWFSSGDRDYLEQVCAAVLRNHFGYDYHQWDAGPFPFDVTRAA